MKNSDTAKQRMFEKFKNESLEKYHVYTDGNFRIRHLDHQSDDLVYIEGNKAIIVSLEWREPRNYLLNVVLTIFRLVKIVIHASEMKTWDNGAVLTQEDRERVTSRISDFVCKHFKIRPTVV